MILGGGFAGLYTALYLDRTVARDPDVEVLLVDRQNFLVFTPMLHEVASGSLDPSSIVVPIRQALRRVAFFQAETTAVDFDARTVTTVYGLERRTRTIQFDYLLIAAGSQTRFPLGLRQHAHGMKTIHDALVLRNWLIGLLERAEVEEDPERRRALLTIVVAGGGFSGVETVGAINDFLHDIARHYPRASAALPSLVLVDSHGRLLPEFEPALGTYTESKLRAAGIDVRLRTKVAGFDGRILSLEASETSQSPSALGARTLIWTAGVAPSPLIESLPLKKRGGESSSTTAWQCPAQKAYGHAATAPPFPIRRQALSDHRTTCGSSRAQGRPQHRGRCPRSSSGDPSVPLQDARAVRRDRAPACRGYPARPAILGLRCMAAVARRVFTDAAAARPKIRVLLQWALDICFARDTVQLLTVQSVRSGRLEELMDSARAAESADEVKPQARVPPPTCRSLVTSRRRRLTCEE